jgi:hypothetical protein
MSNGLEPSAIFYDESFSIDYRELEVMAISSLKFKASTPKSPIEGDVWMDVTDKDNPKMFTWMNGESVEIIVPESFWCDICGAEARDFCICEESV